MAIKKLGPEHSFAYYDLQLSGQEINALQHLRIDTTEQYNNYDNLEELGFKTRNFLQSLNKQNEASAELVSQAIVRIVNDILQASDQETAWVSIRAFTPTAEWKPRWHTDGYYYEPRIGNPYKFALTLKGPPTLFYRLSVTKRDEFYALRRKGNTEDNRQAIAHL